MVRIQRKTDFKGLGLVLLLSSFVFSIGYLGRDSFTSTPEVQPDSKPVSLVDINNTKLAVPTWDLFKTGQIWSVVNLSRQIPDDYSPPLSEPPLDFTGDSMKISAIMEKPLRAMNAKAQNDGVNLMLSSGYRSAKEQTETYDFYLNRYGEDYVRNYVARTGQSEHQAGLSVDLATVSSQCKVNGSTCSLDRASIDWLRQNAAEFGFIERYPAGKQSITGVAGEQWHYRYVGVPLAKALSNSGMTLDEFVLQTAPGYAK